MHCLEKVHVELTAVNAVPLFLHCRVQRKDSQETASLTNENVTLAIANTDLPQLTGDQAITGSASTSSYIPANDCMGMYY